MNLKHSKTKEVPIPHYRLVLWLGVFTLLMSLSAQVMTVETADAQELAALTLQDDNNQGDDSQGDDNNNGQNGEETQDGNQQDQPAAQSNVFIDKFDCPTDSDWSQASYEQLANGCGPNQKPVNMAVAGQGQQMTSSAQWGPYDGPIDLSMSEELAPGYQPPHVVCGAYVPDQSDPNLQYVGAMNSWGWSLGAGESLYCQVFNYQEGGGQFGTILFHKYACPDSWNFPDPHKASFEDLSKVCAFPMANVPFSYEQNGSTLDGPTTDQNGMAMWDQAPAGQATMREKIPSGYAYAVVYCQYYQGQSNGGAPTPMQMQDPSSFGWNLEAGWVLECYWFNFPSDQIQLYKYWCPDTVPASDGLVPDDYFNACTESQSTDMHWELSLASNPQDIAAMFPSDGPPGYAGYHQFQQDQEYRILEQMDSGIGYGTPMVYCTEYQRGNETGQPYNQSYDPQEGITWTPRAGYYLVCNFFNVKTGGEYGQILIEKYWCPAGLAFVQQPTESDMRTACQETGSGAMFELSGPESDSQQWDAKSAEGGPPQSAGWDQVPEGTYIIYETGLDDNWTYSVYCHDSNNQPNGLDGQMQQLVDGGGLRWSIKAGYTLYCSWFNQPTGGGDYNYVDFYKYECAADAPRDADQSYYETNCKPVEGWEFNMQYQGGGSTASTDSSGKASWNGVPVGQWQASETLPEGWSDPIIYCRWVEWPDGVDINEDWQLGDASGGVYGGDFKYDTMRYECRWYNFPTNDIYNYIDFTKYECPVDAPKDADRDYYETNCKPVEGWEFNVQYQGGGSTESTDSSGKASWSGVPVGQWQASETLPEGWSDPIIYCRWVEWPDGVDINEDWQLGDASGGVYGGDFKYDTMRYECRWYNFPTTTTDNSVTVYKWECVPGTEYGREQEYYMGGLPDQDIGPCESEHLGIPIKLTDGAGEHPTTTQANGTQWSGVVNDPAGSWQVMEEIPTGYGDPMVFCGELNDDTQTLVPSTGGMIDITPSSEPYTYQCNWYNVPETGNYNYVDFYKYECPESAPKDADREYYLSNCKPVEGWQFDLQYTDGGSTETTDASGYVSWSGLPTGTWQAKESLPDGWADPVIWCRYVEWPDGAGVNGEWARFDAPGGSYENGFGNEGMRIECYWINFSPEATGADEGTNWITIYKYLCAPDTPTSDDLGLMRETCTESQSGVPFSIQKSDAPSAQTQSTAGGSVEWSQIPAGAYTLKEEIPPGYGQPLIWCGYVSKDNLPVEVPEYAAYSASEGAVQVDMSSSGSRLVCYWFNFPSLESTVTVYKYNCDYAPEGFQDLSGWQQACQTQGDGFTFTLTDSEANATEMVTSGGSASWSDVPVGSFTLKETMQSGWGEPVVWCGWTAYNEGAIFDAFPQQVSTSSGEYKGEISYPGTTYFCYWFNIPTKHSSITIYKFNCPEGRLEGVVPNPLVEYQEMCTTKGNGIEFTLSNDDGDTKATTLGGSVTWTDVPLGPFSVTETLPPGYDPPIWFCAVVGLDDEAAFAGGFTDMVPSDLSWSSTIEKEGTRYVCWVFDFPNPNRTVTVYKWLCPEGYNGSGFDDWSSNCTMPMNNVSFTFSDSNGDWTQPTVGGMASWYGAAQGDVSLKEQIPPGYFEPVVYCSLEAVNGAAFAEDWTEYTPTNGMISKSLDYGKYQWICHYFNLPKGKGDITIYKWLCPPGYDFYGWGANPLVDCQEAWNGITFTLDQPVGPNQQSDTGDSIPGAVFFGELEPGHYVVSETVPTNIDYVFVLDCVGSDSDKVHPYPLQWGSTLAIDVAGGDHIVCNWFNVPTPPNGWVTLYKYQCWTPTFTSTVDCEIYEFGASFELFAEPGKTSQGTGMTNEGGVYTWSDLPGGAYSLDEISHKPCKITSTKTDGKGNVWVDEGFGTVIKVYNCKPKTPPPPGTPTVPGKPPGKYPNTGVGPVAENVTAAPAQATPEGTPAGSEEDYYLISCLDPTAAATEVAAEETASAEETPVSGATETPAEFDLPLPADDENLATPEGTPTTEEECVRGAIPARITSDAIQVDAGIEILEIVDGIMEQPTGAELASWYKETGRLGETNNVVIAAHVNYWGVPEGLFFYLDQLKEGDKVEVTGDDGMVYVYEVQWVRQESNLEAPAADVIGPTEEPSLTLITCGGQWDPSISEYDERTVARAIQVDVRPAQDVGSEQ